MRDAVGYPEDELVRFVVVVSGMIRLAPELAVHPVARIQVQLEDRLLRAYRQTPSCPPPSSRGASIGMQMRMLMEDAERRLVHRVGG